MAASSTLRTVLCGQAFEYQDDELDELDESDIVLTSESEEDISEHDDTDEDEDDAAYFYSFFSFLMSSTGFRLEAMGDIYFFSSFSSYSFPFLFLRGS